jgi:hypothetical protein
MKSEKAEKEVHVTIQPPNLETAVLEIKGAAPYVQHKFSAKARQQMHETQAAGSTAKKGKKKEPKDFEAAYRDAMHVAPDGWCGIPASGLRMAMISACKLCGFQMTRAKLSIFVEPDGFDADDGTPLVRIVGEPVYTELAVRLETGTTDLRVRPMWREWSATVRVTYDADQFTLTDVANLLQRAGRQVGIGEGRADSKRSGGMGWGHFIVMN